MITSPKHFQRKMGYLENIECGCFSAAVAACLEVAARQTLLAVSVFVSELFQSLITLTPPKIWSEFHILTVKIERSEIEK